MHPFSKYIQILGKGRKGMRALTQDEAFDAMNMIVNEEVEPEQLGAFLMLMRVKEETADEVTGFTLALRQAMTESAPDYRPAIDWAAYAGKKRHLPWFLLAALVLGQRGYPVLMHGMEREDERIYAPEALAAVGISTAASLNEAASQLQQNGFCYISISDLSPKTASLIATRELFGLRPPLHTVARMLNPLNAPLSLMGVFHPNFSGIHQQAAVRLGQQATLVCKGEGGELERIPDRAVELYGVNTNGDWLETWDRLIKPGVEVKPESLDLNHFRRVWLGEACDSYGELAVCGTLALVIRALDLQTDAQQAQQMAAEWWRQRNQISPMEKVAES